MADYHGRYDEDQTRDRERSRYGRDTGGDYGRSRDRSMFGGGGATSDRGQDRDADWHREQGRDKGWGGGDRNRDRYEGRFEDGRSTRVYDPANHGDHSHRSERHFGPDDDHKGLPTDETGRLIASNKVEGTAVYGRDRARLGSIYNFMVDKRSGKVEYAVMTYGGFLGMGTRYYPLPWDILTYDTRLGGYHVEMAERDLERAPSFDRASEPEFDRSYGNRVRNWYGLGY
jgi:hypothetical protein